MLKILIVNNAEPGITDFTRPVEKIVADAGALPCSIEYHECVSFDFDGLDGVVLSGSPQGNDIVEHHSQYFNWIKTFEKPVLGICAGHHIIGFLFGSQILRSVEPESGDFEIEIVRQDLIFEGLSTNFMVKQMHNDSITLPEKFEILASSRTCKVQLMKHNHYPIYSCQFHPEFYNIRIIQNFTGLCSNKLKA